MSETVDPRELRFSVVARRRPVALVQPGTDLPAAPCLATETDLVTPHGRVALEHPDGTALATHLADGTVALEVRPSGARAAHRAVSRRHGRVARPPEALALTLTGPLAVAWSREDAAWVARAVVDVTLPLAGRTGPPPLPHLYDGAWLADLTATGERTGAFGQVGLRDLRLVTHADGTPYADPAQPHLRWLTATSAGPGGFRCAHASVWALDPGELALHHRADLFFTRPGPDGRVGTYPDHAVHLVRDADRWLVATSTWGDFDRDRHPHVRTMLATGDADLTRGTHVLDAVDLPLPTDGLRSVGTWDPHLVRTDDGWLVAFVSARRWFRFHPAVAAGPSLDDLRLLAADPRRTATEGVTLDRALDGSWRLLASDGRDSRRPQRARYPVLDLGQNLPETGTLAAAYPTNIPWPTLVPPMTPDDDWLLVGFDGRRHGGPLLGYGTHGDVVLQRPVPDGPRGLSPADKHSYPE